MGSTEPEAALIRGPAAPPGETLSVRAGLAEIYAGLSMGRRRQFYIFLVLMLLGAVAELGTIGAVVPFLALLAQGPTANLPGLTSLFLGLGEQIGTSSVAAAALVFVAFAIAAGLLRITLTWMTQRFVFGLSHDLAFDVLRRILHQPYAWHTQRDVAALLAATEKVDILVFELIMPAIQAAIAAFIAAVVVAGLVYIDPAATLIAAAAFAAIYLLVSLLTRRRLAANSGAAGKCYNERFRIVNESLGGIRDVIIDDAQEMHLGLFEQVNRRLARAKAATALIASAPRFIIESLGMVVIAGIAVVVAGRQGGIGLALPFLGALALGAQRLLPLIQTVYVGWSLSAGNRSIVGQVIELLRLPVEEEPGSETAGPLPLRDKIIFDNLSFTYPGRGRPAVADATFEIPAGSTVALVGETGSGKSTLADLLMGLLEPDEGRICIDGVPLADGNRRRWRRSIAHVPQSIFLADTSIARNIALGCPNRQIDMDRVRDAARTAQLHDFVMSLEDGYDTAVGERGIRLSGGQRQRLGIARAIYKQAPVLVLDEATSALDDATESAVMHALYGLGGDGRTIIVIAHRASTIAGCDRIIRLHDGRIVEGGGNAAASKPPRPAARAARRS